MRFGRPFSWLLRASMIGRDREPEATQLAARVNLGLSRGTAPIVPANCYEHFSVSVMERTMNLLAGRSRPKFSRSVRPS